MDLIFYDGTHSVTFGNKNSWTDWHLIPLSKTVIPPPAVKTKQADMPGCHGTFDLTTVLTGYPLFNNRTGSIGFILAPGFDDWNATKTTVMEYLHGQRMNLYLDDDPGYYYNGVFFVNDLKSDARTNSLTISYDLYPFKKEMVASNEDWLWDPFNFETGIIREWSEITVSGSKVLTISDCPEPVTVKITSNANMTLTHAFYAYDGTAKSKSYTIMSGQTNAPGPTLKPGVNTLTFTGNGKIGINYRGGRL